MRWQSEVLEKIKDAAYEQTQGNENYKFTSVMFWTLQA